MPFFKHNPAFLTAEQLKTGFVVRHQDLEMVLQTVRDNDAGGHQHMLIVGARGMGKTTLVHRAAAAVKRDPELGEAWYPLVLAEELYSVATAGEFWLEMVRRLADQEGGRWQTAYDALAKVKDDRTLHDAALARLRDFAEESERRLLIVVENLNMVLGEQITHDEAWTLRGTLQSERDIVLLATATSRFGAIEKIAQAMFELFDVYELEPLPLPDIAKLWRSVSGLEISERRARPIQILTGGNPRLVALLASFAAERSLRQLMRDLTHLVDDNTTYFKANVESLPARERKVFVTLAELWNPSTSREVADAARLEANKTSALLHRLVERGAVSIARQKKRRKWFQVAERLYNVYHLMRRRGAPGNHIRLVVEFLIHMYEGDELRSRMQDIAVEASALNPEDRVDHLATLAQLAVRFPGQRKGKVQFELTSSSLPASAVAGESDSAARGLVFDLEGPEIGALLELGDLDAALMFIQDLRITDDSPGLVSAHALLVSQTDQAAAKEILSEALDGQFEDGRLWTALGHIKYLEGDLAGAEESYRRAATSKKRCVEALFDLADLKLRHGTKKDAASPLSEYLEHRPNDATAWALLGLALSTDPERGPEAIAALEKATGLDAENGLAWGTLASVQHKAGHDSREVEAMYRRAVRLDPANEAAWWEGLGALLEENGRAEEAELAFRESVASNPGSASSWAGVGRALLRQEDRADEAREALRSAVELDPSHTEALYNLAVSLYASGDAREAEDATRRAFQNGDFPAAQAFLGLIIASYQDDRTEEARRHLAGAIDNGVDEPWALVAHAKIADPPASRAPLLRRVLEHAPKYDAAWSALFEDALGDDSKTASEIASKWLASTENRAATLNNVAFFSSQAKQNLENAEGWARESLELRDDPNAWHTLAEVLTARKQWREAIDALQTSLADASYVARNQKAITNTAVQLAAADYGRDVLHVLQNTAPDVLEPLLVGVRMSLGEDPIVALEIAEVARDVCAQIDDLRRARLERSKTD